MLRRQLRQKLHRTQQSGWQSSQPHVSPQTVEGKRENGEKDIGKKFVASSFKEKVGIASGQRSGSTILTGMSQNILLPAQRQRWEHVAGAAFVSGTQKLWMFQGEMQLQHVQALLDRRSHRFDGAWSKDRGTLRRVQPSRVTRAK